MLNNAEPWKASIHSRLNLMYLVDALCHASRKTGFVGFCELVLEDVSRLMEMVVPTSDARGSVNVAGVMKVSQSK